MQRSDKRILATHVGSLIRPPDLVRFLRAKRNREAYDEAAYGRCLADSVAAVVRHQAEAGIDIVSDGEFGKSVSWSQYVLERLSGFESRPSASGRDPYAYGADRARFKEFYEELDGQDAGWRGGDAVCVGPIAYTGAAQLKRDIDNFKKALAAAEVEEGFLPVAAPSSAIPDRKNEYYGNDEDLLAALAAAMRTEYKTIVDAGLVLQIDDARAAVTYDRRVPPMSFAQYRNWVARHVEALNHALEGIPPERVRYHVCWGSWPGPHVTDVPLKDIVDLILRVNAGAYAIEGANPRHEHEWEVWKSAKLPEDKILIPGVVSHATNIVEHPELVAQRLTRYAGLVGRENVIAGTDCGFAQGPFMRRVHPSIMWAKLEALAAGAALATKALWGGKKGARRG
ncbi:MAG TPA: cobalamin-independent methionine synthase II family protein [Stellaceae bacterium]|nr:cobalamin-independent methionine synthase II family protein [Stellaceae bacterium]